MLKFPSISVPYEQIRAEAIKLLDRSTHTACFNGKTYRFSHPSRHQYKGKQWLWDAALHAWVYAALGKVERSKDELRALFARQQPNGRISHVNFWDPKFIVWWQWYLETKGLLWPLPWMKKPLFTELNQPPILGYAIERIWEDEQDIDWLEEALPPFTELLRYWVDSCDPDKDYLFTTEESFSSGLDNCHVYDPYIGHHSPKGGLMLHLRSRKFNVLHKFRDNFNSTKMFNRARGHLEDVFVNTLIADNFLILARLYSAYESELKTLGHHDEEQDARQVGMWAMDYSQKITDALVEKCWDDETELFYSLAHRSEEPLKVQTIISVMPIILDTLDEAIRERAIKKLLPNDNNAFWSPYPFTITAMSEPGYGDYYKSWLGHHNWRGRLFSINTNLWLSDALIRYGYRTEGIRARERTLEATTRGGKPIFGEFFDAHTGELKGVGEFGWGTLIALMFEEPRIRELPYQFDAN